MKVNIFITMSSIQEIEFEEGKSLETLVREQVDLPDEIMEILEHHEWLTEDFTVLKDYEE